MKKRQLNLELLRIISMLMIILHHFVYHSNILFDSITINTTYSLFISMGGKIGACIFILISSYFLFENNEIKISKILKLWLQVLFYSAICYVTLCAIGAETFSTMNFISCFFPISSDTYWFATVYFLIYMFSPFINKLLHILSKKEFKLLIIIELVICCLLPFFTTKDIQTNEFIIMIIIYTIGCYIKRENISLNKRKNLLYIISLITITFSLSLVLMMLSFKFPFLKGHIMYLYNLNSPLIIMISVLTFMFFLNINIDKTSLIGSISKTTFGVYLIHDNQYLRKILWNDLIKADLMIAKPYYIFYSILVCILIFIICSIIEYIRINTIEKIYSNHLSFIKKGILINNK